MIDTDGHLDTSKAGYSYTTIYRGLADDILYLCRSLGYTATCTYYPNDFKGSYRITISGDVSEVPVLITRKKAKVRTQKKDNKVTGFKVEELPENDYYGFELSGNHLYLMDNFIVTHNCSKTYWLARLAFWFLDSFENSLVVTSAPKRDQLRLGLWSEISMLGKKIKKIRPNAQMYKLRLAMDDKQIEENDVFSYISSSKSSLSK